MRKYLPWIATTLSILFITTVIAGIYFVASMIHEIGIKEQQLFEGYCLGWTIAAYVEDHDDNWPSDWADLRETKLKYQDWSFAEHEQELKQKFIINFNTTVDHVIAEKTWAIKPIGEGHYEWAQEPINFRLIEALTYDSRKSALSEDSHATIDEDPPTLEKSLSSE